MKFLNDSGLSYTISKIKTLLSNKVDKETGKGLSSNDFTSSLKTKLEGVATGAEVNTINSISVNGTAQTITNKNVDITVNSGVSTVYVNEKQKTITDGVLELCPCYFVTCTSSTYSTVKEMYYGNGFTHFTPSAGTRLLVKFSNKVTCTSNTAITFSINGKSYDVVYKVYSLNSTHPVVLLPNIIYDFVCDEYQRFQLIGNQDIYAE